MQVDFPSKLQPLFQPKRYKILYGGRGGAKSWGIARALLTLAASKPIRVLCAREFQKSIKDSVHKLLSDQIKALGLDSFYEVQQTIIKGQNGSTFSFEGLKHNTTNIKSYEGVDICWVEEAQNVSKSSWDILIPTIRGESSEIWVSFNPELEEDETYKRFVLNPPRESFVIKLDWSDNPWFPSVLIKEKDELKERDPDAYLNVWCGQCRKNIEGAIYANEMRSAAEEGRILNIPYELTKEVHTFFDLGRADKTSIWFMQEVGFEFRFVNFYQDCGKHISHYLKYMKELPYTYGTVHLPHDATNELLAAEKTVAEQVKQAGFRVKIVPRIPRVSQGIDALRGLFNRCRFDEGKCSDGLTALRRYRYDVDPVTKQFSREPLHDEYSHACDSLRYFAESYKSPEKPKKQTYYEPPSSWMGA